MPVTLADLARKPGVSKMTVSRVFNRETEQWSDSLKLYNFKAVAPSLRLSLC